MGKVFRLHNMGKNTLQGWSPIGTAYTPAMIDNMDDPSGATATHEITSIPSPFARIDLVKSAFAMINKENGQNISGNTIYHKMVSHALDVAQIFFNLDVYTGQNYKCVELIKWDLSHISQLTAVGGGQNLIGRTLNLFLDQDSTTYNFDSLNGLYLLRYTAKGGPMTIIGATSPATLFFSSANDVSFVGEKIKFGKHKALSQTDFVPLYQRTDERFILYLYALRAANDTFATKFPEVNKYLDLTYAKLSQSLRAKIDNLDGTYLATTFDPLNVSTGVPVEVIGMQLFKKGAIDDEIGKTSDFAIKCNKELDKIPLVLPTDKFAMPWKYVTAQWNSDTEVPIDPKDDEGQLIDPEYRTLPDDGSDYPYLVVNDFLEKQIFELKQVDVDNTNFFDGNLINKTGLPHGYLLPVKRRYFDYFTIDDLKKNIKLECKPAPQGDVSVKVTLVIPVRGGEITLSRMYNHQVSSEALNPRDGVILTKDFTLVLYPMTKFTNGEQPDYRVNLLTRDNWQPSLQFINSDGKNIAIIAQDDKNRDAQGNKPEKDEPAIPIYAVHESFEAIEISEKGATGLMIPLWRGIKGSDTYEFAIDFGTTNTHIEYRVNDGHPQPLDISEQSLQLGMLSKDAVEDLAYRIPVYANNIPLTLGKDIHFPMRTILSYKTSTNWNQPTFPYVTGNLPFYYGSQQMSKYNKEETELKWTNSMDVKSMITCYLGSIMMVIRNKVVMEGGDLSKTKITWFYPTSMPAGRVATISTIWNNLYTDYIDSNTTDKLLSIPESIAPYNYYSLYHGAGVDVLSIDIGGGTSDALVIDSMGEPAFITSFRFAANSLFGDAFSRGALNQNGWVRKFQPLINNALTSNNLNSIKGVLDGVAANQISADYISLLFTLSENKDVKNQHCENKVNFMQMLKDNEGAKTLLLVFYIAIIYHLARIIKAKRECGLPVREPASITFSGNGSKLLQILGVETQVGKETLEDLTKAIFEKVNGREYPHTELSIVTDPQKPKEATCKGGILATSIPRLTQIQKLTQTFLGTKTPKFVTDEQYNSLSKEDYEDVYNALNDFADLFFSLAKDYDFSSNFTTIANDKLQAYHDTFIKGNDTRLTNALKFLGILNKPEKVEDTLFFYPITSILNDLAKKIL